MDFSNYLQLSIGDIVNIDGVKSIILGIEDGCVYYNSWRKYLLTEEINGRTQEELLSEDFANSFCDMEQYNKNRNEWLDWISNPVGEPPVSSKDLCRTDIEEPKKYVYTRDLDNGTD